MTHHEHDHDHDDDDWGTHRRFRRRRQPDVAFAWMGPEPPPFPPMPAMPPMGPFAYGGHGRRRGRGRMGRGMIRVAVLIVLADRPMHGYEVMTELAERSRGMWRPSPGSVYPTLAQLEDQGLVTAEKVDGKRTFSLTEKGRELAVKLEKKGAPWALLDEAMGDEQRGLHESMGQLMAAVQQVVQAGTDEHVTAAQALLDDARKGVYRLLAD